MYAAFNEYDYRRYHDMILAHSVSAPLALVWANLMWLTETDIADYFRFAECCATIVGASDPCACGGDDRDVVGMTAADYAEYDLMTAFAYWRMLPSEVQNLAICDWLNGTSVETPVFQNTDAARLFVIENACHQFGYADSEEATFGKRDDI